MYISSPVIRRRDKKGRGMDKAWAGHGTSTTKQQVKHEGAGQTMQRTKRREERGKTHKDHKWMDAGKHNNPGFPVVSCTIRLSLIVHGMVYGGKNVLLTCLDS
jgi:hypothetical protein